MADSPLQQRALEILTNPQAKESEWIGALAVFDGKLPVPAKAQISLKAKAIRLTKRACLYTVLYTAYVYLVTLVMPGSAWASFPEIVLNLAGIAIAETLYGYATYMCIYTIISGLMGSYAPYPTVWGLLIINSLVYSKGNWLPYCLYPLQALYVKCTQRQFVLNKRAEIA